MSAPEEVAAALERADRVTATAANMNYPTDNERLITDLARLLRAANPPAGAESATEPVDLVAHLKRQRAWSEATFGPGERTVGVIDHIRKELREIESQPSDLYEWIDVVILALDGAWRIGYTAEEIAYGLMAKHVKNEARKWPDWRTAEPGKAIEHDRSGEPEPATPQPERLVFRPVTDAPDRQFAVFTEVGAELNSGVPLPEPASPVVGDEALLAQAGIAAREMREENQNGWPNLVDALASRVRTLREERDRWLVHQQILNAERGAYRDAMISNEVERDEARAEVERLEDRIMRWKCEEDAWIEREKALLADVERLKGERP